MRKTVGQLSSDLILRPFDTRSPIELEREMHGEFEKNLLEAIERGKKRLYSPFYIVVLTKKERIMPNVLREYFIDRQSCPTPEYDQVVYCIHSDRDTVEFLWVIPSKDTCEYLHMNAAQVDEDERWLRDYVIAFHEKRLLHWSLQRNNEICTQDQTCQICSKQTQSNKTQKKLSTNLNPKKQILLT
jgi:hypothetical protein